MSAPNRLRAGTHAAPDIRSGPDRSHNTDRRRAERHGRWAERYVAWRLRLRGWRILDARARTPAGEIDLVAKRRDILAFIEVKRRASWDAAETAIGPRQRARIARAAVAWIGARLARHPELAHHQHRFDAVLVVGWRMRHCADAWRSDDL